MLSRYANGLSRCPRIISNSRRPAARVHRFRLSNARSLETATSTGKLDPDFVNAVVKAEKPSKTTKRVTQHGKKTQKPPWKEGRDELRQLIARGDRLLIGDEVKTSLKNRNVDQALKAVREASKTLNCTVSWNYIIDWYLRQKDVNMAWKTYHEMKKRGQKPDSYTFVTLFRGMARNEYSPTTLSRALSIYHSLSAENSPISGPNIMIANAALEVCRRAKDVDAMWGIINSLPEKDGEIICDKITYTTILRTLHGSVKPPSPEIDRVPNPKLQARYDDVLAQGRKIWHQIRTRWQSGHIEMDGQLVSAMGRLLLCSTRAKDIRDTFALVSQTVMINGKPVPQLDQISTYASSFAETDRWRDRKLLVDPGTSHEPDNGASSTELSVTKDLSPNGDEFEPVTFPPETDMLRNRRFADPHPNILSLLIHASSYFRSPKMAKQYWKIFTEDGATKPDSENAAMMLQIFRNSRSSASATQLISSFPSLNLPLTPKLQKDEDTELAIDTITPPSSPSAIQWSPDFKPLPKHFRLAIAACKRDARNYNVPDLALYILQAQLRTTERPDPRFLEYYFSSLAKFYDNVSNHELSPPPAAATFTRGRYAHHLSHACDVANTLHERFRNLTAIDDPSRQQRIHIMESVDMFVAYARAVSVLLRGWFPSKGSDERGRWNERLMAVRQLLEPHKRPETWRRVLKLQGEGKGRNGAEEGGGEDDGVFEEGAYDRDSGR